MDILSLLGFLMYKELMERRYSDRVNSFIEKVPYGQRTGRRIKVCLSN